MSCPSTGALSRPGYTLVHAVVAMTLMAALLVICTSTLSTLLHADRNMRQQRFYDATIWRLSRQLRDDVRSARAAGLAPPDDGPAETDRLVLHLGEDRQVVYRAESGRIVRTEQDDAAVRRRESFETPGPAKARWELRRIAGRRVVNLSLPRKLRWVSVESSPAKMLRITTVVGADRRFLPSAEEEWERNDG